MVYTPLTLVRAPEDLQRVPSLEGPLHETVEVDLGDWHTPIGLQTLRLVIRARRLPDLIRAMLPWHSMRLGHQALEVFFEAR